MGIAKRGPWSAPFVYLGTAHAHCHFVHAESASTRHTMVPVLDLSPLIGVRRPASWSTSWPVRKSVAEAEAFWFFFPLDILRIAMVSSAPLAQGLAGVSVHQVLFPGSVQGQNSLRSTCGLLLSWGHLQSKIQI